MFEQAFTYSTVLASFCRVLRLPGETLKFLMVQLTGSEATYGRQ